MLYILTFEEKDNFGMSIILIKRKVSDSKVNYLNILLS